MASDYVAPPPRFTDLARASRIAAGQSFNVIGVCVDTLDPIQCRTGQYKSALTLHDPTWLSGAGMEFSFFAKSADQLPAVNDQGDVVVLRNIKTMINKGLNKGISNFSSTWVVLPYVEVANRNSLQDLKEKARWRKDGREALTQYSKGPQTAPLNEAELKYARWIAEQEDPSTWAPIRARTQMDVANTMASNGGVPAPAKQKFKLLQDLELPSDNAYIFADLLGEVRRIYNNDFLTELYVTDYTTNGQLYNYKFAVHGEGRTGDPHGYLDEDPSTWPGPWGQMTMAVRCRDGQSHVANTKVKVGDFVYLRNIQIKMDKDGRKLEGNCRDDPKNPKRELIEVVKAKDERRIEVLRRKRAYEEKAEASAIRFFRDPNQARKRRQRGEPAEEQLGEPKTKRSKNRARKDKRANEAERQAQRKTVAEPAEQERSLTVNPSIRIHNHKGLLFKTIVDILDPDILHRTTPNGNPYRVPFQNCTYKSKVRVVDFFPDNIADFAAPRKVSQYDELDDHKSSDEESDLDLTQEGDGDEIKWEWRFFLLVEDARPQPGCQGRPTQMQLLVADDDGDCLFNMDACDLRDKKNETALASLKEKLFHLWGDLQEKKEEAKSTAEALNVKPSARPFECLIKEYGVPVRGSRSGSTDVVAYDRFFRLFGTAI
ncbi:hypothetical protein A1O7_08647 [Cladophialophora yegresii CBS 114405]|uniref:Protection of telomeres protein 1 n=1 Tax=Cladophialophora yegresii CBS 114405 TaxID=1182544 RepID=W9VJN0_9EURO|nr:uncharacterized protein A1O7_08647 [Cladophialophora yegresii CBS 114405]EXJ55718.1 hypothetical protein A1O7_08647 [Cladophialophora yegresii CBS 114405]